MTETERRGGVLVSGAAGGIGAATVRLLADRGYLVFAAVRAENHTSRVLADLSGVQVVTMDVADPESVATAAEEVNGAVPNGGLRAVVNNAGVIVQGPLELVPPDELRRQFEVNTFGPAYVTQAFLPMLRAGHGRIINVTAPTARVPMPFMAPISASKAALDALSTALRLELAAWKVPVVLVEPGATETQIFDKADTAAREALGAATPAQVALYRDHLTAMEQARKRLRTRPVEPVARAIATAVTARRPRRRYSIADARAIGVLAHLPARLRERLVMSTLGLRGVGTER
ncbi:short-chain dehydrogenase/reductase SDR [Parafrankia sp. EAN1pec]|uniref:SDR family NAD(P)-dependent oxidoreductase n=1 Tax=Parafrankia sp. (strain EAN1pec) TaxID=298653 RepID=UPI0000543971|nr:short-chain dehydrogenase/reductase SDR [Frankia sp. EAN1pec]